MYKVTNKGKTLRYVAGVAVQPGQSVEIDEKFKARVECVPNAALIKAGELEIKKAEDPDAKAKKEAEAKAKAEAEAAEAKAKADAEAAAAAEAKAKEEAEAKAKAKK